MTPTNRPAPKPANLPTQPSAGRGIQKASRDVHPSDPAAGGAVAPVEPAPSQPPEAPPKPAPRGKTELVRLQAWVSPEENARVRNTWAAEWDPEKYPNLSRWVLAAVLEKVERSEREKNNGQPFPEPAGGVPKSPRGRPAAPGNKPN